MEKKSWFFSEKLIFSSIQFFLEKKILRKKKRKCAPLKKFRNLKKFFFLKNKFLIQFYLVLQKKTIFEEENENALHWKILFSNFFFQKFFYSKNLKWQVRSNEVCKKLHKSINKKFYFMNFEPPITLKLHSSEGTKENCYNIPNFLFRGDSDKNLYYH